MKYRNSSRSTHISGITLSLIGILLHATIGWPIAAQTRVALQPFAHSRAYWNEILLIWGSRSQPKERSIVRIWRGERGCRN